MAEDSALSPDVFWMLHSEHSKLLVTQNTSDIILSLKPFGDLFGEDRKWKATYGSFLQISSTLTDWYRRSAPIAHLEDESSLDFLEVLMWKVEKDSLIEATMNELNTEVLVAGADTTAATFEWFILELMRHPHVMRRLRAEIDGKYDDSSPVDEESLLELPYLQAVVKESLRKWLCGALQWPWLLW